MKPSKQSNLLFWAFVVAVVAVVVSVTAGTYYQYKMASAEPDVGESIGMAYQVVGGFKSVWVMVLSFF